MSLINNVKQSFFLLESKDRLRVATYALLRTLLSILDVFGVLLMGVLLSLSSQSFTNQGNNPDSVVNIGGFEFNFPIDISIRDLAIFTVLTFIAKSVLASLFLYKFTSTLAKSEIKVTEKVTSAIINSSYLNVTKISKSDLTFALTYASAYASTSILTLFVTIISEGFMLIGIAIIFFVVDPAITLATIAYFFMIGYVIQKIVGKHFQEQGLRYSNSAASSIGTLDDLLKAFKEIRVSSKSEFFTTKFMRPRAELARANAILNFLGGLPRYIIESALMIGALLLAGVSFASGDIGKATATIGIFLTGGFRIMASMLPLQNALGAINLNSSQASKFFEALGQLDIDPKTTQQAYPNSTAKSHEPIGIKLINVSYSYGNSDNVLSQLNMDIKAGSTIAIIGPSGSGKSTLADLILGILSPKAGQIQYQLKSGKHCELDNISIGYVPQLPGIISGSVVDNIALGVPPGEIDFDRVYEVLNLANLSEVVSKLEKGVHTDLGAQLDVLSGGQMQRIGLARALYESPGLLILDEATSALDAESELAITNSIERIGSLMTVIVIAHRISTVQNSDHVYVLEDGQITGNGTFSELMNENSLVAKYVEIMNIESA